MVVARQLRYATLRSHIPVNLLSEQNYRWGFSFIQLNIMLILCILWTVGIAIMWTQSYITMKNRGRKDVAGEYKAVLELADALNTTLVQNMDSSPQNTLNLTESTIRRRITKDLHGGSIAYETPLLAGGENGEGDHREELRKWLKKEAWWILVIVVSLAPCFFLFMTAPRGMSWILVEFLAALVFTVCIGTSGKSRGVLFLWSFTLLCLIPLLISVPVLLYTARR
jgi:hypothetical protein